jgi:hypothetical protein
MQTGQIKSSAGAKNGRERFRAEAGIAFVADAQRSTNRVTGTSFKLSAPNAKTNSLVSTSS